MIYLVGCNHGIQSMVQDPWLGDSAQVVDQKKQFRELLRQLIRDQSVGFVGEEWGLCKESTAQCVARSFNIPWANINTGDIDLDRLGIPRDYANGKYTRADRALWNSQREDFMLLQISSHRGTADNVLIICGFDHLDRLSARLGRDGEVVTSVDYRNRDWYERTTFPDDCLVSDDFLL